MYSVYHTECCRCPDNTEEQFRTKAYVWSRSVYSAVLVPHSVLAQMFATAAFCDWILPFVGFPHTPPRLVFFVHAASEL